MEMDGVCGELSAAESFPSLSDGSGTSTHITLDDLTGDSEGCLGLVKCSMTSGWFRKRICFMTWARSRRAEPGVIGVPCNDRKIL